MGHSQNRNRSTQPAVNYGISFSVKQCRNFDIDSSDCLQWLLSKDFRRFRLMSYWNEIEPSQGKLDFKELDMQIGMVASAGGTISLCLGARQPRWPENHWPDWAWELESTKRTEALLHFIRLVVDRYRDNPAIVSYQLENEALLKAFGERSDVDRPRLLREYELIKTLDPQRPIIMTTSTTWGIPIRGPVPDIVGFSYYQKFYNPKSKTYNNAFHTPLLHRMRGWALWLLWQKPTFIHELQLEPWGPKNIWEMDSVEQNKSMDATQIKRNLELARAVRTEQIDIWGAEWWYWRSVIQKDNTVWEAVQSNLL